MPSSFMCVERTIAVQEIGQDPVSLVERKAREVASTLLVSEPRVKLFLFGSRATGRAGVRSDIDVGIDLGHPMVPEVLAAVRDAFDDLPILQKVDVVDFSSVDEAFRAVALQQTRSLYERQTA
ncbi:MAG: nucleotidyltransferase domain-containing protein [Nitrospira sp.]|nr:nucleotidyltransferase domain-containing protein [Nitrospira sp.]MCP9442133.1 nucleotidyltransferase domain-containing protein [Nitrospira sp.]